MNNKVYRRKVDTPDELLARILNVAAYVKKGEDQLRRTARDLRTHELPSSLSLAVGFANLYI